MKNAQIEETGEAITLRKVRTEAQEQSPDRM